MLSTLKAAIRELCDCTWSSVLVRSISLSSWDQVDSPVPGGGITIDPVLLVLAAERIPPLTDVLAFQIQRERERERFERSQRPRSFGLGLICVKREEDLPYSRQCQRRLERPLFAVSPGVNLLRPLNPEVEFRKAQFRSPLEI